MKVLDGYAGLGDNIYQRPLVRAVCEREDEVFLMTPWPQIYKDIPRLKFIKPKIPWRTQNKNIQVVDENIWSPTPKYSEEHIIRLHYTVDDMHRGNMLQAFENKMPLNDGQRLVFDLPKFDKCPVKTTKPICVVRPVTHRREWFSPARSPLPGYVHWVSQQFRVMGYHVVSVADLEKDKEWMEEPAPYYDVAFHKGELGVEELLSLIQSASVVVGGVGWIVPASIAANVPLFIIFGGNGRLNALMKIVDPRMDLSKVGWALPDAFCRCDDIIHDCNKRISKLPEYFYDFLIRNRLHGHFLQEQAHTG